MGEVALVWGSSRVELGSSPGELGRAPLAVGRSWVLSLVSLEALGVPVGTRDVFSTDGGDFAGGRDDFALSFAGNRRVFLGFADACLESVRRIRTIAAASAAAANGFA